jgi:superkiller protein 3
LGGLSKKPLGSEEVLKELDELAAWCPSLSDVDYFRGLHLLALKETDKAISSFRQALKAEQRSMYYLGLGQALLELKAYTEAEEAYKAVLSKEPESAQAYRGLSSVYYTRGELDKSEEVLRNALQANPEDAELFYALGLVLAKNGRSEEALVSLKTATAKAPNHSAAHLALAGLLLKQGKYLEANKAVDVAGLHDPRDANVWLMSAAANERLGNYEKALKSLEKAEDLIPDSATVEINSAVVLSKLGENEQALSKLEKVVESGRLLSEAYSALGWVYLRERRFDEAEKVLRKSLAINDSDPFALNNLGIVLESSGREDEALPLLKKARKLAPNVDVIDENVMRLTD